MTSPDSRPSEPLRIALFSGNYNYVMDGPVRALNTLVDYLEKKGHEVLVFAPTTKSPAFDHSGKLISIPSIALPGKRSEYRLGFGIRKNAREQLKAFSPNLIHIAAPDLAGLNALKYSETENIPAVASFHTRFDTYPRYYKMGWAEKYLTNYMRRFYARCEHVYAPSQSMVDELQRDGIGQDIRIWTRGVDSELFNPSKRNDTWRSKFQLAETDIAVAFVGRVVLEKGIDLFCDAFTQSHSRNPHLKAVIVGDGPELDYFKSRIPEGKFAGYLQGEDLARAYASSDVFFNPSITETFGNVTLEAMACGLPSIGASAAGSKSLIEDGKTGLLAPPNAAGFAEKLDSLAASAELRAKMSQAARQKALTFSWSAVLDELIGHYYQAISGFRSRQTTNNSQ